MSNWEISLNYNSTVLTATGITIGNLFPASSIFEPIHCIDGVGTGCGAFDGPGVVHSAVLFRGGNVSGTFYNQTLFSIQFSPTASPYGSSLLHVFNDSLGSPGRSYINPYPILHLTEDGIFANHGVAAFFNVAGPAIFLVGQPVYFDASGSFDVSGAMITLYSWSFGDGSSGSGVKPVHTYSLTGEHIVVLNVTSVHGTVGVKKVVNVVSALGGILLHIKDRLGNNIPYDVVVTLSNSSGVVARSTKSASLSRLNFSRLAPGTYAVGFAGSTIVSFSGQESVIAGWTTEDTVYLTVVPPSSPPDLRLFVIVSVLGVGLVGGGAGLFLRRRRALRMGKTRAPARTRKASESRQRSLS
jgi:hypothetical protein